MTLIASADPSLSILTLSFRGDFELCQLLCESVDDFVSDTMEHVIAVPRSDLNLFKALANGRRRLITQEELLPAWLRKIPLPGPTLRRVFGLPRRNVYFTPHPRIVRGWIVQQLMKLRAAATATSDVVLHADSDMVFIRPLKLELIVQQGRVRLYRKPGAGPDPRHQPWHAAASRLLGLPPSNYHGAEFIQNAVAWRRDCVVQLLRRISEVVETDPMVALAATDEFAEYILYGVFCERILTLESSGHFASSVSLCKTAWLNGGLSGVEALLEEPTFHPEEIAVGIQSTLPMGVSERRAVIHRLANRISSPHQLGCIR
jgi:uncharacterized protein DUF6492